MHMLGSSATTLRFVEKEFESSIKLNFELLPAVAIVSLNMGKCPLVDPGPSD